MPEFDHAILVDNRELLRILERCISHAQEMTKTVATITHILERLEMRIAQLERERDVGR